MRRVVPWVLLLLIGLGAGLGAALGSTQHSPATSTPQAQSPAQSPARWVAGILAATEAAGTAQLEYAAVTTSPNPVLRGTANGRGVVDFAAGTFRVTEVEHQNDWTIGPGGQIQPRAETFVQAAIAVGPAVYLNIGPTNGVGWSKESVPRDRSGLGLGSAVNFPAALSWLSAPYAVRSVRDLGPAQLDGVATTRYLVRTQLPQSCTRGSAPTRDTTVWVDGHGRLVQVQNAAYASGTIPAAMLKEQPLLADRPQGSTTQHNTLRFSAFGQRVHVAPPTALADHAFGSSVAVLQECGS